MLHPNGEASYTHTIYNCFISIILYHDTLFCFLHCTDTSEIFICLFVVCSLHENVYLGE